MRRISSELSWIYRRLIPLAAFAIAAAIAFNAPIDLAVGVPWETALIWIGFAATIVVYGCLCLMLPGKVVDLAEDALVVDSGRQQERIGFDRIDRVSEVWANPEIIEVRLKTPGQFGRDIRFIPKQRWYWQMFVPHPVVVELRDPRSLGKLTRSTMTSNLVILAIILGLGVAVWRFAKPPATFVVRIRQGQPKATYGKVTEAFLSEVAELCREQNIAAGEIRGVPRRGQLGLWFSREIPGGCRQRLRNWWAMSGWRTVPRRAC